MLNDMLLFTGGHTGYGIRPSMRNKGYATHMLALGLDKCLSMNITTVLITCDADNKFSAKVITSNGGIFENEVTDDEGCQRQRYWITL